MLPSYSDFSPCLSFNELFSVIKGTLNLGRWNYENSREKGLRPNVYFSFNLKWIRSKGFSADEKAFMFSLNHSSIVWLPKLLFQITKWYLIQNPPSLKGNPFDKYSFCKIGIENILRYFSWKNVVSFCVTMCGRPVLCGKITYRHLVSASLSAEMSFSAIFVFFVPFSTLNFCMALWYTCIYIVVFWRVPFSYPMCFDVISMFCCDLCENM